MISGHATVSTAVEATKLGAFDFIEKPLSTERVLVSVRNALDQQRLTQEVVAFRRTETLKHQLVGESAARSRRPGSRQARGADVGHRAHHRGERRRQGTGGARHSSQQPANARAFIQVNCAAIPDDLIESELFGHEKGSFTGATEKQIGKFEQADRGTIFLDEVGDMSLKTQAKVLRVLQEGEVERLGSARTIKVDVRVIAATNKRLEDEVEKGQFREDLYFRLNVIPIHVPPLRERPGRHRAAGEALPRKRHPREQRAAEADHRRARWRCWSASAGAATSASCATPSSGWSS